MSLKTIIGVTAITTLAACAGTQIPQNQESRKPEADASADLEYLLNNAPDKRTRGLVLIEAVIKGQIEETPAYIDEVANAAFSLGVNVNNLASSIKSPEMRARFYGRASYISEEQASLWAAYDPSISIKYVSNAAEFARKAGDDARAKLLYQKMFREVASEDNFSRLMELGAIAGKIDDKKSAQTFYAKALVIAEKTGDYNSAIDAALKLGNPEKATYYRNLQTFFRRPRDNTR